MLYTDVFEWNLEAYESKKYRAIINQGSTRSTKTYSITQLLALYIPFKEKTSISIVGPSLPHLKRGARRDFLEIMESSGAYRDSWFNKTDNIYHYPNGSYIEFFGAEDLGKVRGPGRKILYLNEMNLFPYPIYKQLALRTEDVIFGDLNPVEENCWAYEVADAPGNIMIHSTYLNNPFLSKEQREEIESLKDADENLWKVFGLGLRGASSEIIYTHWKVVDEIPQAAEMVMGQDFGYNVPSALLNIGFYEGGVYWDQEIYETKLTTGDLIEYYKQKSISRRSPIYCDNAEPKTIEEICRAGFNAKPADKDVTEGIRKVKAAPLYITRRSVDILKEIRSYKWKTDKDGRVLDEPVKFMDHAMDAGRYGTFTHSIGFKFKIAVA